MHDFGQNILLPRPSTQPISAAYYYSGDNHNFGMQTKTINVASVRSTGMGYIKMLIF